MRMISFIFFLFYISGVSAGNDGPTINVNGILSTLSLPSQMVAEFKKVAPSFKQYPPKNFPKEITDEYKFSKNQMISAVIGDFNGDSVSDVIIQGYDKEGDITYKILSSGKGYKFSPFGNRHGSYRKIPSLYNSKSKWQYGMKYYSFNEAGSYFYGSEYKGQKDKCPFESLTETSNADGTRSFAFCWVDGKLIWDGESGD